MKKFGLIIPDSKKKPIPSGNTNNSGNKVAAIFNEADDSEEEELAELRKRQSQVTKSISTSDQFVAKLHEEALNEDPNVFDYDAAVDGEGPNLKNSHRNSRFYNVMSREQEGTLPSKEPKYMHNILAKAEERKIESELIKLRNMKRKSALKDGMNQEEEEVFVTSAYKKRLEELEEKEKELKERQKNEEDGDVTKRKDMSGFYYNLMKRNVSFGGSSGANKATENEIKRVKTTKVEANLTPEITDTHEVKETNNINNVTAQVTNNNTDDNDTIVFGPRRPPSSKK